MNPFPASSAGALRWNVCSLFHHLALGPGKGLLVEPVVGAKNAVRRHLAPQGVGVEEARRPVF